MIARYVEPESEAAMKLGPHCGVIMKWAWQNLVLTVDWHSEILDP